MCPESVKWCWILNNRHPTTPPVDQKNKIIVASTKGQLEIGVFIGILFFLIQINILKMLPWIQRHLHDSLSNTATWFVLELFILLVYLLFWNTSFLFCVLIGYQPFVPWARSGGVWRPPMTATAVGGTHPTGMHSCFFVCFFFGFWSVFTPQS